MSTYRYSAAGNWNVEIASSLILHQNSETSGLVLNSAEVLVKTRLGLVMVILWISWVTKAEFLLAMPTQYQTDKWWE